MDMYVKTPISAELRARSERLLEDFDAVIGPTTAGGWYAVGLRDRSHAPLVEAGADSGAVALALLRRNLRVAMLPVLGPQPNPRRTAPTGRGPALLTG
ncbi:hypothetical protein [Mangrovihabitans endophyticus]|nr:hypothetical protein [Mangrovihabitans endophyticus]